MSLTTLIRWSPVAMAVVLASGCSESDPTRGTVVGTQALGAPGIVFDVAVGDRVDLPSVDLRDQDGLNGTGPEDPPLYGSPEHCDVGFPPDVIPRFARAEFSWGGSASDAFDAFDYRLSPVDVGFRSGTSASYDALEAGAYTFTVRGYLDGEVVAEACRYFDANYEPSAEVRCTRATTGECVLAYRIASSRPGDGNDECGSALVPWSWESEGLPEPPFSDELPDGYVAADEVLGATEAGWFIELDVVGDDLDGDVVRFETNSMPCIEGDDGEIECLPSVWRCAPVVRSRGRISTIVAGPFPTGHWRVEVAAVDDALERGREQRGAIDVRVATP